MNIHSCDLDITTSRCTFTFQQAYFYYYNHKIIILTLKRSSSIGPAEQATMKRCLALSVACCFLRNQGVYVLYTLLTHSQVRHVQFVRLQRVELGVRQHMQYRYYPHFSYNMWQYRAYVMAMYFGCYQNTVHKVLLSLISPVPGCYCVCAWHVLLFLSVFMYHNM